MNEKQKRYREYSKEEFENILEKIAQKYSLSWQDITESARKNNTVPIYEYVYTMTTKHPWLHIKIFSSVNTVNDKTRARGQDKVRFYYQWRLSDKVATYSNILGDRNRTENLAKNIEKTIREHISIDFKNEQLKRTWEEPEFFDFTALEERNTDDTILSRAILKTKSEKDSECKKKIDDAVRKVSQNWKEGDVKYLYAAIDFRSKKDAKVLEKVVTHVNNKIQRLGIYQFIPRKGKISQWAERNFLLITSAAIVVIALLSGASGYLYKGKSQGDLCMSKVTYDYNVHQHVCRELEKRKIPATSCIKLKSGIFDMPEKFSGKAYELYFTKN